jgi:lysophospholipase L1-like esterase
MEDRFVDADRNGRPDLRDDWAYVTPAAFVAHFNACVDEFETPAQSYSWTIDGTAHSGCQVSHAFPRQGTYDASLTISYGASDVRTWTRQVEIRDIFIVSLGDSFASGEGAPDFDRHSKQGLQWSDRVCHRSALSGPARAALEIERSDPHTSVTFVSLACSGATLGLDRHNEGSGVLGGYRGIEGSVYLPAQIDRLTEFAQYRRVDAVLLSAGGNDIGFADIAKACVLADDCHTWLPPLVFLQLKELEQHYVELSRKLLKVNYGKLLLTGYPFPGDGDGGVTCPGVLDLVSALDARALLKSAENAMAELFQVNLSSVLPEWFFAAVGFVQGTVPLRFSVDQEELGWIKTYVVSPLNAVLANAARGNPSWTFLDPRSEFRGHGLCASDRWFNTMESSMQIQGPDDPTTTGTLHPNALGQQAIARVLIPALRSAVSKTALVASTEVLAFPPQRPRDVSVAQNLVFTNEGTAVMDLKPVVLPAQSPFSIAANYCTGRLSPSSSCAIALTFTPTTRQSPQRDWLIVEAKGGEGIAVELRGEVLKPVFSFSSDPIVFAPQNLNEYGPPIDIAIKNVGADSALLSEIFGTADNGSVYVLSDTCPRAPATLDVGATCSAKVALLSYAVAGPLSGFLHVSEGPWGAASQVGILGEAGPPVVGFTPDSVVFPQTEAGRSSSTEVITVVNEGVGPMRITSLALDRQRHFLLGHNCPLAPDELKRGESCQVQATFHPLNGGGLADSIRVVANVPGGEALAGVTGESPILRTSIEKVDFGSESVGATTPAQTITVFNQVGLSVPVSVKLLGASANHFVRLADDCDGRSISPEKSCVIAIAMAPGFAGSHVAELMIESHFATQHRVLLEGQGVMATGPIASPSSIHFSPTHVGTNSIANVEVINPTSTAFLLGQVSVSGTGIVVARDGCTNRDLPAGDRCLLTIQFSPRTEGSVSGSVTLDFSNSRLTVAVEGQAIAPNVEFLDGDLVFPAVSVGDKMSRWVTIKNSGSADATSVVVRSSSTDFTVDARFCPEVLRPTKSCSFQVVFSPASTGFAEGLIQIEGNVGGYRALRLSGGIRDQMPLFPTAPRSKGGTSPSSTRAKGT